MRIDILTLFPAMFMGPLQESILKRAQERSLIDIYLHQIRDYAFDRHQMTDDTPYGGGQGMVMKPEPIFRAVRSITGTQDGPVVLLSPQGRTLTPSIARCLAQEHRVTLICGHYEGVDERIRRHLVTDELSIGDYVLTGGELAAMVLIDVVARFIPGVLGAAESAQDDSYTSGLLEGPQYTRPAVFETWTVPDILRSGHHAAIDRWHRKMALQRTWQRRRELVTSGTLTESDQELLTEIKRELGEPDGS